MELPRDDHKKLHGMTPEWQARGEVIATIVAHSDRGDGYCDVCKVADPCKTRLWHENVLARMGR